MERVAGKVSAPERGHWTPFQDWIASGPQSITVGYADPNLSQLREGPSADPPVEASGPLRSALGSADPGEPLDPNLRARLESRFGRDFSHVRIHRGPAARRAAQSVGARAFTHRRHIWLASSKSAADPRLIAHELAHVEQQGEGRPGRVSGKSLGRGRTANAGSALAPGRAAGASTVQRLDIWGAVRRVGGAVASGVRSTVRAAGELAGDLLSMGRDALMSMVRRIAPDFARLFERGGIRNFLRDIVARGLRTLFGGGLGVLRGVLNFGGSLSSRFRQAAGWFSDIAGRLARNDCAAILGAARRVGSFISSTFGPVIDRLRGMARSVSGFFRSIFDAVSARVMPLLRRVGGAIWNGLRRFISDVGALLRRVKSALGAAWTRVKDWLGIGADEGSDEGGGLWNWIKEKASGIWEGIQGSLRPVMGPLRAVGGVLLAISPAGPVLAVIAAWPHLRRAFQWVRERWHDLNLVVRARNFFANTVLPSVIGAANRVGAALLTGADWLLGMLDRVAGTVGRAASGLGGILAPLRGVIQYAQAQFQRLVRWARSGLRYAAVNARSLFQRLIQFLQPILRVLRRLIAIAVNPFGIPGLLLGTLWRLIPTCLKGPLIDFIINILIRIVRIIPGLGALGILWEFIKSAILGFLERLKRFALERKVAVSNKIANIISGGSATFALGYLRGLVLGLWEGITGPFQAIASIFQLPELIRRFLNALGLNFSELLGQIRETLSSVTERAVGTLESLMEAARDLISDPRRLIQLIQRAIEAAMSAVRALGATIAERMMALFEGPDDRIGESLGRLVGSMLVDAVLAFFTAGGSGALTALRTVARVLRTVGRHLMRVVRMVTRLIPRFLRFVRRIGGMFRRARSAAGRILGRIRRFFQRIVNRMRRMMRRVRRRRRGRRGRRGRRNRIRRQFRRFVRRARGAARRYRVDGVRRSILAGRMRALRARFFRAVASVSVSRRARGRTPRYHVRARRRRSFARTRIARVLADKDARWRLGRRVIRRRLRRIEPNQTTKAYLDRILLPFKRRFRYKTLNANYDSAEKDWDIDGSMSPGRKIAEVDDLRGLHKGTRRDPIPINWYKPENEYITPIRIKPYFGARRKIPVGMFGNTMVRNRYGENRRVGINASNLVRAGKKLTRVSTPRGGAATSFRNLLISLGFSMRNRDADHVKDLAFGGLDTASNLWPLRRSINQRASRYGQWYNTYRIEYIKKTPGRKPERDVKAIRSLTGKVFRVIGFSFKNPNPGGRDR